MIPVCSHFSPSACNLGQGTSFGYGIHSFSSPLVIVTSENIFSTETKEQVYCGRINIERLLHQRKAFYFKKKRHSALEKGLVEVNHRIQFNVRKSEDLTLHGFDLPWIYLLISFTHCPQVMRIKVSLFLCFFVPSSFLSISIIRPHRKGRIPLIILIALLVAFSNPTKI